MYRAFAAFLILGLTVSLGAQDQQQDRGLTIPTNGHLDNCVYQVLLQNATITLVDGAGHDVETKDWTALCFACHKNENREDACPTYAGPGPGQNPVIEIPITPIADQLNGATLSVGGGGRQPVPFQGEPLSSPTCVPCASDGLHVGGWQPAPGAPGFYDLTVVVGDVTA